ncbi:SDR family NAD(P)-dependent oxidoreductase [Streptomyces sp. NPDC055607]
MTGTARTPAGGRSRAVVVTGASSGLGRECALHLEGIGFRVFAGVRREQDAEALAASSASGRLHPVLLDVTDGDSVRAAAARVAGHTGGAGAWGLVNNAGICLPSPLECLPPERLRHQMETNVIGQLTVVQAFLPQLRATRGRIVNVTSGLGRIAGPFLGGYACAQFAKEAMTDALRREVRDTGVRVSLVRPGAITTPIWDKVVASGARALSAAPEDVAAPYERDFRRFLEATRRDALRSRTTPADFARVVARALTSGRPRTRYAVGPDGRLAGPASRLLPDAVLDRYFARARRP